MSNLLNLFEKKFKNKVNITKFFYREEYEDTNNLGILNGLELETKERAAFIYHWSKGFIHYSAINLISQEDLISDKMIEFNENNEAEKMTEILEEICKLFR